ncbi:MAG: O-antigen ligase family protein [Proteobacteria bacterium]|nr:O-antigen ligase family protein [Pseudomonadota bacterium]
MSIFLKPEAALYLAYPALVFIPYEYRLPIPVFGSVFGLLLLYSMLGWLLFGRRKQQSIPSTHFNIALLLFVIVLVFYGMIGYGDPVAAEFRVKFYILGLWSLLIPLFIINTPQKVRWLLFTAYGTIVVVSLLIIFTVLLHGPSLQYQDTKVSEARNLAQDYYAGGFISYMMLISISLTFPVHLSLFFDKNIQGLKKLVFGLTSTIIFFAVFISSYASPLVCLMLGWLFLLMLKMRRPYELFRPTFILLFFVASLTLAAAFYFLPAVGSIIERLLNPQEDASGGHRIDSMIGGVYAFLESPLFGHGAYNTIVYTPQGNMLGGHNSYIMAASEYGLIFLLPLLFILFTIIKQFYKLMNRTGGRPIEGSVVQGMFAGVIAALVTGFITPVFGNLVQDSYFWLSVSLMSIWNYWLDENPKARLML